MWFLNREKNLLHYFAGDIEISKFPFGIQINGMDFYDSHSGKEIHAEFDRLVRWLINGGGKVFCFGGKE